jgi:hypothetical protein
MIRSSVGSECRRWSIRSSPPKRVLGLLSPPSWRDVRVSSVVVFNGDEKRRQYSVNRSLVNFSSSSLNWRTVNHSSVSSRSLWGFSKAKTNDNNDNLQNSMASANEFPSSDNNNNNNGNTSSDSSSDFSSSSPSSSSSSSSVDETLNRLFEESQQPQTPASPEPGLTSSGDAWYSSPEAASAFADWSPVWYNLADQAVVAVQTVHDVTGLEYGWSIVAATVILRMGLFPLMVRAQQSSSRMAHVQPELNAIKQRYEVLGTPSRQD